MSYLVVASFGSIGIVVAMVVLPCHSYFTSFASYGLSLAFHRVGHLVWRLLLPSSSSFTPSYCYLLPYLVVPFKPCQEAFTFLVVVPFLPSSKSYLVVVLQKLVVVL
jgi:hypothetical protein